MNAFINKKAFLIGWTIMTFLVLYTFWDIIMHPNTYLLGNNVDGLKNYFGYLAYLKKENHSLSMIHTINYPFGESIHYLDIMPVLSFIQKLISTYLFDISRYALSIHNLFVIGNIMFCFVFVYLLMKRWISNKWLLIFSAVIMAMTNPMLYRINNHFALSLSSLIVGYLYFLSLFYDYFGQRTYRKCIKIAIILIIWICFSCFCHVYFLALLSCHLGFSVLLLLISHWKKVNIQSKVFLLVLPLISPLICLVIIYFTDTYYALRTAAGSGYNWDGFNFRLDALYSVSGTPVHTLPFFIQSQYLFYYETLGYLGGYMLYGILFLIGYALWKKKLEINKNEFIMHLGVVSILMLSISLGHTIHISGGKIKMDNVFSLFFWLSKVSQSITQFRVLSRFNWLFFFGMFIWATYYLDKNLKGKIGYSILTMIILIGMIDVYDWATLLKQETKKSNPLLENSVFLSKIKPHTKGVKAIYYFPFFHVGTSELDHTLDDYLEVSTMAFQTTLSTDIPMVNIKASRTPTSFSIFQYDKLNRILVTRYTPQDSVLMVYYNHPVDRINHFKAENHFFGKWKEIIQKANGKFLFADGDYEVYLAKI